MLRAAGYDAELIVDPAVLGKKQLGARGAPHRRRGGSTRAQPRRPHPLRLMMIEAVLAGGRRVLPGASRQRAHERGRPNRARLPSTSSSAHPRRWALRPSPRSPVASTRRPCAGWRRATWPRCSGERGSGLSNRPSKGSCLMTTSSLPRPSRAAARRDGAGYRLSATDMSLTCTVDQPCHRHAIVAAGRADVPLVGSAAPATDTAPLAMPRSSSPKAGDGSRRPPRPAGAGTRALRAALAAPARSPPAP